MIIYSKESLNHKIYWAPFMVLLYFREFVANRSAENNDAYCFLSFCSIHTPPPICARNVPIVQANEKQKMHFLLEI